MGVLWKKIVPSFEGSPGDDAVGGAVPCVVGERQVKLCWRSFLERSRAPSAASSVPLKWEVENHDQRA